MGLLEWIGLKKREPIVCADCEYYTSVVSTGILRITSHKCNAKNIESVNFITVKKTTINASCSDLNSKGNCRHFMRKVKWSHDVAFKCAECKHYVSPHCEICRAETYILGEGQRINKPRSVLNADGKCRFFIPSFVDSE